MFRCILLLLLVLCQPAVQAVQYRALSGMSFPTLTESGPKVSTRRAEFNLPVISGEVAFDITLDAPEGARMLVMGEQEVDIRITKGERLWDKYDLGVEQDLLAMLSAGTQVKLDPLPPGRYTVQLSGMRAGKITVILDQPLTKYPLHAKLTPYVARLTDTLTVTAWFDEPETLERTTMRVHFNQRQWPMRKVGARYQADVKLNLPDEFDAIQHFRVVASAEGRDGTGAQRNLPLSFLVSQPVTGFKDDIFVNETGGLDFTLIAAEGRFRLDVLYGFEGKAIAMARDYVHLQGEPVSRQIDRPDIAGAADKALVRLFNMDTLEVEDQALLELPIDREAQQEYQHKPRARQELSEQEKEALKALDVQDKHPHDHHHHHHNAH